MFKMNKNSFTPSPNLLSKITFFFIFFALVQSGLLFQQSSIFGTVQVKLTTTSGFISAYSDNSFTVANPGYINMSSVGLALCGYDIPASQSLQFRAQASYDDQADSIVIVIIANSSTTFYFLNYFILMATNSASSYLYIDNPCFLPTFDINNSGLYNRSYTYAITGPFNINSTQTVVGIPYIRSLSSIANSNFNYYNITNLSYSGNKATITVFVNFSQVSEICTSIIYQHRSFIISHSNTLFLNISSATNLFINASVPTLTLASVTQFNFGMSTIYGPNYTPKCLVGLNAVKLSANMRQTLSFNMTGLGIYDLVSSTTYQLTYSWFCIAEIKCPSTNYQYYPVINQCQPTCTIANCTTCSTSTSCLDCQDGFFISVLYRCLACIPNCQICTNPTNCQTCYGGFFFSPTTSTCSPCSLYCNNCTSTQCLNCQTGYFASANLCYKCSNFMSGCITCTGSTICNSCPNGTIFTNGICTNCSTVSQGCTSCNAFFCFVCGTGFYLNGNLCQPCTISQSSCCSFFVPNCALCKNQTACTNCQINFYLSVNSTCLNCSLAITNCLTCTNSTTCTSCATGFALNNSICLSCSVNVSNCRSCQNVSQCLVCISPFTVVNGLCYNCPSWPTNQIYFLNSNNTCISCTQVTANCLRCNSSTTCTLCSPLYYLNANICNMCSQAINNCLSCVSATECSICITGFYLNRSNTSSCLTCSSQIPYCLSCNSVYYNNINTWVLGCSICMPQYFINKTICSPCIDAIPFCLTCLNSYQCKQCATYYYLSSTLTCIDCQTLMPGCLSCNSSQCLSCALGYYLVNNYCTLCSMAINSCSQCSYLNSNITCQLCLPSYYISSKFTCISCNTTLPFCINCINSTTCVACLSGYISSLTNSTCQPCSVLIPNCLYCNPDLACQKCLQNYQLNSNGECIDCNTYIPGCNKCANVIDNKTNITSLNCTVCNIGYLNYTTTNNLTKCIACNASIFYCATCNNLTSCKVCLNISFLNDIGTCSLCSLYIANCRQCANNSYCLACVTGYYTSANSTSCLPCDPRQFGIDNNQQPICNKCKQINGVATCMICQSAYYQFQNGCKICSDSLPYCAVCDNDYSCNSCESGYYLSDNFQCVQCDSTLSNCAQCTEDGICLQCNQDYYLNSTINKCTKCNNLIAGCFSCFSNMTCTKCLDGYYIQGQSCVKCSLAMADCVYCYNSSYCSLKVASASNSPPITTLNWYVYFILILVFIALIVVIVVCWRKYKEGQQQKLLQKSGYTVSDTQRQLVNQQKEESETREGELKVQEVKVCQGCNKNNVLWMNLQLLCRPCTQKQGRGNQHKIKKDFKKKVKKLVSRIRPQMQQNIHDDEDGFRPQKPSEIKEQKVQSQPHSSNLRSKPSLDFFVQPPENQNQTLQIQSKVSKQSKIVKKSERPFNKQKLIDQVGTSKKLKKDLESQS